MVASGSTELARHALEQVCEQSLAAGGRGGDRGDLIPTDSRGQFDDVVTHAAGGAGEQQPAAGHAAGGA
jgi:hypothetical protein